MPKIFIEKLLEWGIENINKTVFFGDMRVEKNTYELRKCTIENRARRRERPKLTIPRENKVFVRARQRYDAAVSSQEDSMPKIFIEKLLEWGIENIN